jgi:ADP-ribose pyrophosphatase
LGSEYLSAVVDERELARGRFLRFVVRDGWEFADRVGITGIVGIVAVTDDRKLLLVEQHRPPVGGAVLELPAGLVGDEAGTEHEDLVDGARRELLEETGFEAANWEVVASGPTSPGTTSEIIALLLATELTHVGPGGGHGAESLTVHEVPLDDAEAWLCEREKTGVLIDLKIYAGLWFARCPGRKPTESRGESHS